MDFSKTYQKEMQLASVVILYMIMVSYVSMILYGYYKNKHMYDQVKQLESDFVEHMKKDKKILLADDLRFAKFSDAAVAAQTRPFPHRDEQV